MWSVGLVMLLLGESLWIPKTWGFVPTRVSAFTPRTSQVSQWHATFQLQATTEYTSEEVQDMENFILSLAGEATDESRRQRLAAAFDEALAKPNGAPKRYCDLFDQTLIHVGDRIRLKAQKEAMENQKLLESIASDDDGESDPLSKSQRTQEQWQLWSMVDMMIQSKTIVKRANGSLGSNGSFG